LEPRAPLLVAAETEELLIRPRDHAAAWRRAGNQAQPILPDGANDTTVVLDEFAMPVRPLHAAMLRLIRERQLAG